MGFCRPSGRRHPSAGACGWRVSTVESRRTSSLFDRIGQGPVVSLVQAWQGQGDEDGWQIYSFVSFHAMLVRAVGCIIGGGKGCSRSRLKLLSPLDDHPARLQDIWSVQPTRQPPTPRLDAPHDQTLRSPKPKHRLHRLCSPVFKIWLCVESTHPCLREDSTPRAKA